MMASPGAVCSAPSHQPGNAREAELDDDEPDDEGTQPGNVRDPELDDEQDDDVPQPGNRSPAAQGTHMGAQPPPRLPPIRRESAATVRRRPERSDHRKNRVPRPACPRVRSRNLRATTDRSNESHSPDVPFRSRWFRSRPAPCRSSRPGRPPSSSSASLRTWASPSWCSRC